MSSAYSFDVIILGGGIVGAAIAAHLAPARRIALIEREQSLGYHTTGRSSAMFAPCYGGPAVQKLTAASAAFFRHPPAAFAKPLIEPRPIMHIASIGQLNRLAWFAAAAPPHARFEGLDGDMAADIWPGLRRSQVAAALLEQGPGDLNVDGLMQGYIASARAEGAAIITGMKEMGIARRDGAWRIRGASGSFSAPVLVNATGAWADEVAIAAGAASRALEPLRRTVVLIDPPDDRAFARRPVVFDVDEHFYFRPFGKQLLVTLADETPSPPCDARPEEETVAQTVARFETVCDQRVARVTARWAGLRTFAPDRAPVIGWAGEAPGFFWAAGLGGFGIQTSPAVGELAARLIMHQPLTARLKQFGICDAAFSPQRAVLFDAAV